jgi:phosphatidylinositol glycan class M
MWSLWFLPLALPLMNLTWKKGLVLLGAWIAGQGIWLSIAYRLEFLGQPVFAELWVASLLFFAVNVGIVYSLLGQLEKGPQ